MSGPYVIEIYCRDRSHEDRRWIVGAFSADIVASDRPDAMWWTPELYAAGPGPWWTPAVKKAHMKGQLSAQLLDGDRYVPLARLIPSRGGERAEPTRVRYKLRCRLCGRSVVCGDERMQEILTRLAGRGGTDISLAGLAAII